MPFGLLVAAGLSYTTLDAVTARRQLEANQFAVLIDVRRQDEWDAGHLPNATFLESLQTTRNTTTISQCKQCRVALYCRTGRRSKEAANVLEADGFTNVVDVLGVTQWTADAGMQLVTGASRKPICASTAQSNRCAWPPPRLPGSDSPSGTAFCCTTEVIAGSAAALLVLAILAIGTILVRRRRRRGADTSTTVK